MPITTQRTVSYVFANMNVDAEAQVITANMRMFVEEMDAGLIQITIQGPDYLAFVGATPAEGMMRADDIALAVYNYAVSHGYLQGSVS